MKKFFVLIVALFSSSSLYSFVCSSCTKKKDEGEKYTAPLSLYNYADTVPQKKWTHASHASHYSATNIYPHSVKQNNNTPIILNASQLSEIKSIVEKAHLRYSNDYMGYMKGYSFTCSDIKVERLYLCTIDGININKNYFKVSYMVSMLSPENVHTNQYYIFYVDADKSVYFLYRTESPHQSTAYKLKDTSWLKEIIDNIE